MDFWVYFWGIFLVLSVLMFAVLAVVVSIGSVSDIREMFKTIDSQHEKPDTGIEGE